MDLSAKVRLPTDHLCSCCESDRITLQKGEDSIMQPCGYPEDPAASRRPTRRSLHTWKSYATVKISGSQTRPGRGKVICAALISCGSMSVNPAVEKHMSNVGGNTTAGLSIFQFRNRTERQKLCCVPAGSWTMQTRSQRSRFGKFSLLLK